MYNSFVKCQWWGVYSEKITRQASNPPGITLEELQSSTQSSGSFWIDCFRVSCGEEDSDDDEVAASLVSRRLVPGYTDKMRHEKAM